MTETHIEQIYDEYRLIAIVIYSEYEKNGIEFFTPNTLSQQLAYMKRPKGYRIPAHVHLPVPREVKYTQETLFIRRGRIKVNFYRENKSFLTHRELKTGDVILLVSGGHDFLMLEETEMIEVKQGPYAGENDKERFDGVD